MNGENFTQPGTNEAEFIRILSGKIMSKLNFFEIAIFRELSQPEPDYINLLETIRSQQKNNDLVMNEILGMDASELLEKILP